MRTITRLVCGASLCAALAGCSKDAPPAEPVSPVQVAVAAKGSIRNVITADAVLYPRDQANIMPKVSAPIRRFLVNRGDHVRQGQLLAELENRDLVAAATESRGQLAQAESNARVTAASVPEQVTKAQTDVDAARAAQDAARKLLDSRQQLLTEGAIARKSVDEAQVAFEQAKANFETAQQHLVVLQAVGKQELVRSAAAQVEAARGRHDATQAQVSYSEVNSPITGVVTDRPLYPGEMASTSAPLFTVMDMSAVVARVNLAQEQAKDLRVGNTATLTPAGGGDAVIGRVTIVSPAVDPNTTTVQVWVQAPNPGERLRAGTSVHVAIVAETIDAATVIPAAAILPNDEGGEMVITVDDKDTAHHKSVKIGVREAEIVQVLDGIQPGERIVVVGGLGLEDGARAKIVKPGAEDAAEKKDAEGKK